MDQHDVGPFDSGIASDFLSDLYTAEPQERLDLVEAALNTGADPSDGFLDSHEAVPAIAAAAIVQRMREHAAGRPLPDFLTFLGSDGLPPLREDIVSLAIRALDRALARDSELNEQWAATSRHQAWRTAVLALRAALEGHAA